MNCKLKSLVSVQDKGSRSYSRYIWWVWVKAMACFAVGLCGGEALGACPSPTRTGPSGFLVDPGASFEWRKPRPTQGLVLAGYQLGYQILDEKKRPMNAFPLIKVDIKDPNQLSFKPESPFVGGRYYRWAIRAVCMDGEVAVPSAFSPRTFRVKSPFFEAPELFASVVEWQPKAQKPLKWSAVLNPSNDCRRDYNLQIATDPDFIGIVFEQEQWRDEDMAVPVVVRGGAYTVLYWRVRAVHNRCPTPPGSWSKTGQLIINNIGFNVRCTPRRVGDPVVGEVGPDGGRPVEFVWINNCSGLDGYRFYLKGRVGNAAKLSPVPGFPVVVPTGNGSEVHHVLNLKPGTYVWWVEGFRGGQATDDSQHRRFLVSPP